ncbi:MAG: diguanylate cyclase [Cyanobacteria bacterium SIG29]|nr:diguanylate cyclase [Cyanobacteria bacterium SIG29]
MSNFFNFIYRHRYDIFSILVLVLLTTFVITFLPQKETKELINYMENKSFDIRQRIISKEKKSNNDIVIITVDDPSYEFLIEKYGDWPVPRNVYGDIVEYVQSQNPKYIVFDLLFIKSLKRIPGSDSKFLKIYDKYDNIYTALNFDDYDYNLRIPPIIDKKISSNIKFNENNIKPIKFTNCRTILQEIIDKTDKIGHINTPKADDGFTREIPVFVSYPEYNQDTLKEVKQNNYLYLTIKLCIDYLNKYENANITDLIVNNNNELILGSRTIPLTQNAKTILNWYGDTGLVDNTTFKYVSFWEIIKSIEAEKNNEKSILDSDTFKDKIVFIGTSVFSLSDIKTVPTSKSLPGVELHATLFNNVLDNNLIHKASLQYNIIIAVLLALLSGYTAFKIRSVYISVFLFSILIMSFLYFSTYIMKAYNVWIWIVIPLIFALLIFVSSFIVKYLLKSRDFEYTYKLATTDGLTELFNHRFFQEQIKNKIEYANKTKGEFSLILLDIDFFKKFNDKYGHQAGDAVLRHVAKTLKSCVRTEDYVCRYGGEEMTIILNNTKNDAAIKIAQKICDTIAGKKYELTPDLEVNITVSLGVATYPHNGKTSTELIEYADKCLYKAKENGRNQVGFIE